MSESSIPPVDIPQIIKSAARPDKVADLSGAKIDNPLIGFNFHNGVNQKWFFGRRLDMHVIWTETSTGERAFANATEGGVHCNPHPETNWHVKELPNYPGLYTISVRGAPDLMPLFWTLKIQEGFPITLELLEGTVEHPATVQLWTFGNDIDNN